MAQLIKTNGTVQEVTPANGKAFTLEELQGFVGGYIEPVRLGPGKTMLVNEEGLIQELPYNSKASQLAGQVIVGNAVVVDGKEWN